jgi:outer membrane protein assembly factor BamB
VRRLDLSQLVVLTLVCSFSAIAPASAQEWTRFRGPNGSGVSSATTIPVRWTEKEYNWKVKLPGVGHSSPVLWGERIFITSGDEQSGKRLVFCLRAKDGGQIWSREFPGERHGKHTDNSFASATPAVDERHLYLSWATPKEYLVMALDHDGKEVWRVDLGPFKSGHGFGSSPIVHEAMVILSNDQDGQSSLLALDRASGKERWKVARQSKASYATPCIFQPKDRPPELIFTSWEHGITSIDPKTGRKNWESDIFSKGHTESPIASPIVAGDLVLGTCGWLGVKKEVVAVRPLAPADKRDAVYRLDRSAPLVPTPLVKDDLLFLWSDEGHVSCADVKTGEVHWRERVPGAYYGSPVWASDKLYCMSRDGDLLVLAASKKYEQLARNPLGEGSHSTPAIAGGRMYLRTFSHLISIGK